MSTTLDTEMIKKAILDRGLKKNWVADQIGVEPETFSSVLSGKKNLGRSALILLSQILEVDPEILKKKAS